MIYAIRKFQYNGNFIESHLFDIVNLFTLKVAFNDLCIFPAACYSLLCL